MRYRLSDILVTKRDGRKVPFNDTKICQAVKAAYLDNLPAQDTPIGASLTDDEKASSYAEYVMENVLDKLEALEPVSLTIEQIQDIVVKTLLEDKSEVGKRVAENYISYRAKRTQVRTINSDINKVIHNFITVDSKDDDEKRENANINADTTMGILLKVGSTVLKEFNLNNLFNEKYSKMHREGRVHLHDLDLGTIDFNCIGRDAEISIRYPNGAVAHVAANRFDPFYDEYGRISFNGSLEILTRDGKWTKLIRGARRPEFSHLLHFRTPSVHLRVTDEHRVPVIRNGEYIEVLAKDIALGDRLIKATQVVRDNVSIFPELNLIDAIGNNSYVYLDKGASALFKKRMHTVYSTELFYRENPNIAYHSGISLDVYLRYRNVVQMDERAIRIKVLNGEHTLPAILPLTYELGRLAGLFYTEGSVSCSRNKNSPATTFTTSWTNSDPELIDEIYYCFEQCFPGHHLCPSINANGCTILTSGSVLIYILFSELVAIKRNSAEMSIPYWYANAPLDFLRGFVTGEIDGDGYIGSRTAMRMSSVCAGFMQQFSNLLGLFGVTAHHIERKTKGTVAHFRTTTTLRKFNETVLSASLIELYNAGLLEGSVLYRRAVERYGKEGIFGGTNYNRTTEVIEITEEPYSGYVYDFETEDHYFVCDNVVVHNCLQLPLNKLLKNGFSTGHGYLRTPTTIQSAASLTCIAIQSSQGDFYGGQSIPSLDYYLAPYVLKSFVRRLAEFWEVYTYAEMGTFKPWIKEMDEIIRSDKFFKSSLEEVQEFFKNSLSEWEAKHCPMTTVADMHFPDLAVRRATKAVERDTQQAMESLVHNLCTLNSRSGSQTPFSSVNYGIDTSWAGRLVSKSLMDAIDAGLGLGETAIFPIAIMKLKKGITDKGSPNYDLFKQSCRVSAKRLFPNWVNLDAPFNLQYYKPDVPSSQVASMGCRTRVISNDYDPTHVQTDGRGNLFWTTVNLPYLALEAKEELIHEKKLNYHLSDVLPDDLIPTLYEKIVEKVDTTVDDVLDFSMARFEIIAKRKAKNYPFAMCQHEYVGSENLKPEDEIRDVLKQGTISIGFIGLAETLITLMGKHHGESDLAQAYGLRLIGHMRDRTDKATKELGFNFSLMGSPAEGCTGRLCRLIKKRWGILPGITDKEYLCNSSHLPPKFKTTISNKVLKEVPYHTLENAGGILYIELDAKTVDNTEGFEQIVTYMADQGAGYFAINHPVTRDPICGYVGPLRSDGTCPRCGRKSGEGVSVEKLLSLHAYSPDPEYAVTAAQLDQDDAVSNDVDF